MNGRSREKLRVRDSLVEAAARRLRTDGVAGASVARVMGDAGLTVGGFYGHFRDKDHLVADGLRAGIRTSLAVLYRGLSRLEPRARFDAVLGRYLSTAHRDHPAEGCPMPGTLSELSRSAPEVRQVVAEELERWAQELDPDDRPRALAAVALMAGGVGLARALGPTPLSDELLAACRQWGTR